MAQVQSADARQIAAQVALVDGVEQQPLLTVALPVQFQTAKAKVFAMVTIEADALATDVELRLVRNPASDNVEVADAIFEWVAGELATVSFTVAGVDSIASPRDVVYALAVTLNGDAGLLDLAYIEAMLLSG